MEADVMTPLCNLTGIQSHANVLLYIQNECSLILHPALDPLVQLRAGLIQPLHYTDNRF